MPLFGRRTWAGLIVTGTGFGNQCDVLCQSCTLGEDPQLSHHLFGNTYLLPEKHSAADYSARDFAPSTYSSQEHLSLTEYSRVYLLLSKEFPNGEVMCAAKCRISAHCLLLVWPSHAALYSPCCQLCGWKRGRF